MENRISIVVLTILAAIFVGVFVRQFQINPAVVALRPGAHVAVQTPPSAQTPLIDVADSGIVPFSPPERFDPDTLYEKINGRADLYLSSGFVSLATQRFAAAPNADQWVELFVYDMKNAQNAYSVFTMQRREDAKNVDLGTPAYETQNALFAIHGGCYLELVGTNDSVALREIMQLVARRYIGSETEGPASDPTGADLFPRAALEPDSIRLILANAFGYEYLDRVYTAQYRIDENPITAFVSLREDEEQASKLVKQHEQTLINYGATVVAGPAPVDGAIVVQFFDTYEVLFHRGRHLAGIHEASNLDAATKLSRHLAEHLENVQ